MHWVDIVYQSAAGEWMREAVRAMPVMEAVHIVSSGAVFGIILFVDLRLLGRPDTRRPVTRLLRELIPPAWIAFALSAFTGAMMFAANAPTYVANTAFQLKMAALLAAGVNMGVFHIWTLRSAQEWDIDRVPPSAARAAALLSMLLWAGLIVLGRWIGFTKGFDFTVPAGLTL